MVLENEAFLDEVNEIIDFNDLINQMINDETDFMELDNSQIDAIRYFEYSKSPQTASKARAILKLNNTCEYLEPVYMPEKTEERKTVQYVEKETGEKLEIYPNPADKFINVYWKLSEIDHNSVLNIYDNSGKLMLSKNISAKENSIILSVSDFSIGNYTCVIKGDNDVLKSVKFTKSK